MVYLTKVSRAQSIAAFVALLLVATVRIIATYSVFNDTIDEPWHIACGMEWLSGHTYDCNPEHPPLARAMMAIGPYLAGARDPGLQNGQMAGRAILHHGNFDRMLTLARIGILPFFWLAVLVVYLWARRSFGEPTAFFATLSFTMFPAALAHAGLATTDMPATASIGAAFLALLYWLEAQWGRSPTCQPRLEKEPGSIAKPARSLLLGAALALAILSKFSSLAFLPSATIAALAAYLVTQRPNVKSLFESIRRLAPSAAMVAATTALLIWAGYRFHYAGVPAPELWQGIHDIMSHNATGHPGYLLGHYSEQGWWYYYPVAIFFKTPIALLALMAIGLFVCWKRRGDLGGAYVTPLAYALGMIAFGAVFGHINLGIRHILPAYIGFSIVAGVGAQWLWNSGNAARAAAVGLLVWLAASSALSHPDYLAYFNAFAGKQPERILVDSDLDWGQDMKRLAARLKELDVKELAFNPFNGAYVEDLQVEHKFPPTKPLDPNGPSRGWNAASLTPLKLWRLGYLKSDPTKQLWTDRIPPTERVGKGVLLWYVP
jgi:4-amino-4-deoxy-L-arabinose transferase-like glycosyltransferase